MKKNKVKSLYAIAHAKWYDFFKRGWNLLSSGSEKDLADWLIRNLKPDSTLLELACGTAENLKTVKKLGLPFRRYIGLDFSPDMLAIARRKLKGQPGIEFHEQDITRLDRSFMEADLILCTWALSHIPDPIPFINQAKAHLKPGGKMFLIFLSEPKWFICFWLTPFFKWFASQTVPDSVIHQIPDKKQIRQYLGKLVTVVRIEK